MLEVQQRLERTFGDPSVLPELRAQAIAAVTQALLTMALLTMALLTMALLTIALLTIAAVTQAVRLHAACNARRHGEATAAEVVDEGSKLAGALQALLATLGLLFGLGGMAEEARDQRRAPLFKTPRGGRNSQVVNASRHFMRRLSTANREGTAQQRQSRSTAGGSPGDRRSAGAPAPLRRRMSTRAQLACPAFGLLLEMVDVEHLLSAVELERIASRLLQRNAGTALAALSRTLTTTNPGGAPRNEEARRQLIFFCNSLHNSRLMQPPSVRTMRSFSSFTP